VISHRQPYIPHPLPLTARIRKLISISSRQGEYVDKYDHQNRERTNRLHPLNADTTLLLDYLPYILLVLIFYIYEFIVKPNTNISI
jgi:hypothetical protein